MVSNITNTRRTEIKTPDVVIHVDPDRAALIETQIINGRKCIVIPMEGDVEINGIHVTGSFSEDNNEELNIFPLNSPAANAAGLNFTVFYS